MKKLKVQKITLRYLATPDLRAICGGADPSKVDNCAAIDPSKVDNCGSLGGAP
jgi:hypothetical protein